MAGFGDEADLDAAEQQIDSWQAAIEEQAVQAKALSKRLSTLTVTARSRDGMVEATLDTSGTVTALHLDERIRQQPAAQTAERILAVFQAARTQLARQVGVVTAETIGADTATGKAIIASYANRLAVAATGNDPHPGGGHGRR